MATFMVFLLWMFSVATLLLAPNVFGQATTGQVVKEIDVRYIGAPSVDKSRILANIGTRVGDVLTQEKLENDIKSLFESGDVDDVRIFTEPVSEGVRMVVVVSTRALLAEVVFNGNAGLSDRRLRRAIDLDVKKSFDDVDLKIAEEDIEALYQKKGYADAGVSYRVEQTPEGFSRVVFAVDEGAKRLLKDILFEGNTVFKDSELKKQLQVKEKSIFRLFIGGGKIDRAILEEDVERLENYYGDSGYIDADVEVEQQPLEKDKVNLLFRIAEGQKYDVASVKLEGISIFTEEELTAALQTESGLAYSVSNIRTDESTLRDFYGAKGYADVRVNTRIDRAEGNQLAVTYLLDEGLKSYIRKIDIEGNQKTKDKVIRRELAVAPGDEYNLVKVDASRKRLQSLQYFSAVDIFPSETDEPGYKDINVTVEETSTGSINFGAGFSSIDNLVGFVDVVQTNFDIANWGSFTGGGQRFQSRLQLGTERKDVTVSLYEPWFNDYKVGLGGEVFFRDLLFLSDDYDQTNFGGRAYTRRAFESGFGYFQFDYRLQNVEIDVDTDASDILQEEEGDFLQSQLEFTVVVDRRDSNLLTRSGYRTSFGASLSGGFLGGDVETYGIQLAGSRFFSLPFDTILSVRGSLDVADTFSGGESVPIFERVFLGGSNDLRGFDFRDVGPKDENGEPLGGGTGLLGSAEYSFPIFNKIRGAVFYDVGFVNDGSWDFSGSEINSNFGLGLRLFLGSVPIRLDYGIPVQSDEFNDSSGRFNFNLGYQFQ